MVFWIKIQTRSTLSAIIPFSKYGKCSSEAIILNWQDRRSQHQAVPGDSTRSSTSTCRNKRRLRRD